MSFILTPDGGRFLRMATGAAEPVPFHLRWLLPSVCGESLTAWLLVTYASIASSAVLIGLLALKAGASQAQAIFAAALWLGLPSIRLLAMAPVLVDAFGIACSLASAYAVSQGLPWTAAGIALVGAAAWEKAPVFAALFAWSPWPLIGLVAPVLRRLFVKPGVMQKDDPHRHSIEHPLETGLQSHAGKWRDPIAMLAPWGACLWILSADPSIPIIATLAFAYSQLLLATDTVRLYQHAAPVVCISAAMTLPIEYAVPIALAHWMNPLGGDGV